MQVSNSNLEDLYDNKIKTVTVVHDEAHLANHGAEIGNRRSSFNTITAAKQSEQLRR